MPVLIKEKRMIMISGREFRALPGTFFKIFSGIKICLARSLSESGEIVHSLVIAKTTRPRPTPISIFPLIQVHGRYIGKRIVSIIHQFPIHQVI